MKLEINFFPVALPESLPVYFRRLSEEDRPLLSERRWGTNTTEARQKAVLVDVVDEVGRQYEAMPSTVVELSPSVVRSLLTNGLIRKLASTGYYVERNRLSFTCCRIQDILTYNLPDCLMLRRGVEFWVDHLNTQHGRRLYGFFISPSVKQRFRFGLENPNLARSAIGERVNVRLNGVHVSAKLVEVPNGSELVTVAMNDNVLAINIRDIEVPASSSIVRRFQAITGGRDLSQLLREQVQMSSFSYSSQGRKNRRWVADQHNYVGKWLVQTSEYGLIRFPWLGSSVECHLQTRPTEVFEGELS